MSTARQIIALLKSHIEGEEQQFYSAALQIAAHEARQGHGKLAEEIRELQHFRMLWGTVAAISKPVFEMFRIN